MSDKDKTLMRVKDLILLLTAVIGLLVGAGRFFVAASVIENNKEEIKKLIPKVEAHGISIAVNDERWTQIQSQIKEINQKLDRRGR